MITAHSKEFEILLKNSGLNQGVYRKSLGTNIILIKGVIDKIVSENKVICNKTGNSVMTKGGTGDVLSGLAAGFVSQGNSLFNSACMAAYLNGTTGDYLLKKKGRTFIASELIENFHKFLQ